MEKDSKEKSRDMAAGIIIQARVFSTRLPFKALYPLYSKECGAEAIIQRVIWNCVQTYLPVVLAIPKRQTDDILEYYGKSIKGVRIYRGSEEDVLDRMYRAANKFNIDPIIRITADCPLLNSEMISNVYQQYIESGKQHDYFSNCHPTRTVPKGYDVEIFTFKALKRAWKETKSKYNREHVTPYFYTSDKFKVGIYQPDKKYNIKENYSIDTINDYLRIKNGK